MQWCSQNRVVARAQVDTGGAPYTVLHNVRKVSMRKHDLLGGSVWRHAPLGKFLNLGPPRSHLLGFQAKYV